MEAPSTAASDPELLRELRARRRRGLARRDNVVAWAAGGIFAALAVALALAGPTATPDPIALALFIGIYAVVSRVRFEVGHGQSVPTQLVFVPMLFALPPAIVPMCVAAGLVVGSAAHALGPAAVLAFAGSHAPTLRDWPVYTAALGAQFAAEFLSNAPWARWAHGVGLRALLEDMRWTFLVDAALAPIGLVLAIPAARQPAAVLLALPLVGLIGFFAREREIRIDHALELSKAYRGTAMLLGDVIEADDAYTGSHSRDVVDLVLLVADRLGLAGPMRRDAEFAALLHDVGKVKIPSEIINKPGSLDDEEWEIMKTHTIAGEEMLERVGGVLGHIGKIVRSCHERWDGQGYPDGLAAEKIPLIARIVMCCDAFSAMTTDRAYRKAMSEEAAVEELLRCSGTHFDPRVVDALVEALGQGRPQPLPLAA